MVKRIIIIILVALISFFSGKLYVQKNYKLSQAIEARSSFFSNAVSSMSMLEFNRDDISLSEKIHLANVKSFFNDEISMFPMFIPQNSKEERAYKMLKERAKAYQEKYCKSNCLTVVK